MDLTNLTDGSSLFQNQPLMTDYPTFEENVKNTFEDILGKSSDMDGFNEAVS